MLTRADFGHDPHAGAARNNAAARGWGPGWPNCSEAKMARAAGGGVAVQCRRELTDLISALLNATAAMGYHLKAGEVGAFACRPIRGTRQASNHSWGLAIDINWNDNPMGAPFRTDIPPRVAAMWEACGFYWGGRYMRRPDTMHFEYIYRPSDVAGHLAKARSYLRSGPNPSKPTPAADKSPWDKPVNARPGSRILDRWCVGTDVALLQRYLAVKADGYYGADTIAAVRRYQRMRGLDVDGVAGPKTWAPILRDLGLAKGA